MKKRTLFLSTFLAWGLLLSGCDLIRTERPEEARLVIEGNSSTQVRLIVSGAFISGRQEVIDPSTGFVVGDSLVIEFFTADTAVVSIPFDKRYDISVNEQFYARVLRTDDTDGINTQLLIDGDIESESPLLADQDSIVIVYNFGNRVPEDETVEF